jgi:hypothetical protein
MLCTLEVRKAWQLTGTPLLSVWFSYSVTQTYCFPSAFRSLFLAISIAGILPLVEIYGVLAADIVGAIFGWISFGFVLVSRSFSLLVTDAQDFDRMLLFTIHNGAWLRGLVDVGFSTENDN